MSSSDYLFLRRSTRERVVSGLVVVAGESLIPGILLTENIHFRVGVDVTNKMDGE